MTDNTHKSKLDDIWDNTPVANLPHRRTDSVNEVIELYQGPAIVHLGDAQLHGHGLVSFCWYPEARTEATLTVNGIVDPNIFDVEVIKLELPEINRVESVIFGGSNMHLDQQGSEMTATFIINGHDSYPDISAHRAQTLMVNGPSYAGHPVTNAAKTSIHCGRLSVDVDGWLIDIDHIDMSDQLRGSLKHKSGYAFTHTITISRPDNSSFAPTESNKIYDSLIWFFSFLCGRWCGITLPVYLDRNNNQIYEDWRLSPRLSRGTHEGWNIPIEPDEFRRAFISFYEFTKSPGNEQIIRTAIHWYVQSSMGVIGSEGGIILNQTAIELLSYHVLVDYKISLSEDGYSRLPAEDKLRLLLGQFNGQLSIPNKYHQLQKACAANNWVDGPEVLTRLRNALVHRTNKKQQLLDRAQGMVRVEAWWLGLYYIELSIMWLIGYSGRYHSRIHAGKWRTLDIPTVPWSLPASRTGEA